MFVFIKKFSAGSSAATWLIAGVYVVGKGVVYLSWADAKSLPQYGAMGAAGILALIPATVQYQAFTKEFMGLKEDEISSCKLINKVCDNKVSKFVTAVLKAAFASGSLSMVVPGLLGGNVKAGIFISCTALPYVISQYFVMSNNRLHPHAPETTGQFLKRIALMTGAGFGGIMSAGMPLFGLVNIIYMVLQKKINPSIDHNNEEVLRMDEYFLGAVTPAIVRHAIMYAIRTHNKLRPGQPLSLNVPELVKILDKGFLIPYSSLVTSVGSLVGPLVCLNALLELFLNDQLKLGVLPSILISVVLIVIFGLPQNIYNKYAYLYGGSYGVSSENAERIALNPDEADTAINDGFGAGRATSYGAIEKLKESSFSLKNNKNDESDEEANKKSFSSSQSFRSKLQPQTRVSFWKRVFCCSGKPKEEIILEEEVSLENDSLLLGPS